MQAETNGRFTLASPKGSMENSRGAQSSPRAKARPPQGPRSACMSCIVGGDAPGQEKVDRPGTRTARGGHGLSREREDSLVVTCQQPPGSVTQWPGAQLVQPGLRRPLSRCRHVGLMRRWWLYMSSMARTPTYRTRLATVTAAGPTRQEERQSLGPAWHRLTEPAAWRKIDRTRPVLSTKGR